MAVLGTQTYDNLIVGGDIVTDSGVLIAGQNLTRGALLGKSQRPGSLRLALILQRTDLKLHTLY